jgi:hypothetical protein
MRRGITCLAGLVLAGWVALVRGASVEADPNKEYLLGSDDGPWMICISSYRGDEDHQDPALRPKEMARRLVLELRRDYNLEAFMFNRSEELRRQQQQALEKWHEKYDAANQKAPARKIRIPNEWAVMVGHYKDLDDAGKAVAKLKKQPPPKSVKGSVAVMSTKLSGRKVDVQAAEMNVFAGAFACRNPLAPKPPRPDDEDAFDPFLTKLNAGEPYNLLKAPRPYTLMVKVYQGATVVVPDSKPSVFSSMRARNETAAERQFRLFNQAKGKNLDSAGDAANNLAKILRHKDLDYQSYVLHTRDSSIVTVGSFDSPNDRELLRLQRELAGKKIGHVDLIGQPRPVKVPRP